MRLRVLLTCLTAACAATPTTPASATFTMAPGYAATEFAVGFPRGGCCNIGPLGIAFDTAGNTYVSGDGDAGSLYKFPAGGTPPFSAPSFDLTASSHYGLDCVRGLAFSKGGRLYLGLCNTHQVVELSTTTGAILRVAAPVTNPHGMATDPLSGDLFAASYTAGEVYRIANPDSAAPTVSTYVTIGSGLDGLTIGLDGTMYVARANGTIYSITGTDKTQPAVATPIADVPGGDGVAASAGGGATVLFANDNFGNVTRLDFGPTVTKTVIFHNDDSASNRGDFVGVGNDGCLYATQSVSVVRITNADGTCSFAPTSPKLPLGVTVTGNGAVASAPAGIDCGATCAADFDTGTVVTLTATPASGRHFIGWSGDCTGKALTCQVTMDKARSVTATFAENVPPVAAFTFAPATALTGQAVAFDGSGSSDSDGTVVSYAWSFGASGVKATNGFPTPGTFEVTLTVTDDSGATGSVTHAVPVSLPPVIAPPAAAVLPISLQCTTRRLVLIDVLQQAGKVVLLGAADPKLAGQTVNLTLAASGTTVATAVVGADGTFQTTAPLPAKKIRNTNAARYRATVGAEQSDFLKLTRRMQVDSLSAAGGQVTIKGRITKPLGKKVQRVQVRQRVSCQQTKVVKSFKPPASGRFSVTFPAPTGQSQAIYTLTTKVRKNTRNPKLFPTASLPRPVTLGG